MPLKPEVSIPVALATAGVVYGIYNTMLPTHADVRAVETGNLDIQKSENTALWTSVAVTGAVSLISQDVAPFVLGGLMAVALSWAYRHANAVDPQTQALARLATQGPGFDLRNLRKTFLEEPA